MLPFKLKPAYKDYLWGGTKLKTQFGKGMDMPLVAESWELSAHLDGDGIIADGPLEGTAFSQFARAHPRLLGRNRVWEEFPILIKLIDAQKSLSVQVHPDDAYARQVEGSPGKTEMWHILDCEPEAYLYLGFRQQLSTGEIRRRIQDDTITQVLAQVPVKPGDTFFIPAGIVHAIGAGILLAEIQQNSNITYRVYDFGRRDAQGNLRELHIDKALEAMDTGPAVFAAPGAVPPVHCGGYTMERLATCGYFMVGKVTVSASYTHRMEGESFVSLLCTQGEALLECDGKTMEVAAGDSVFVPADNQGFTLTGKSSFLITTI